MALSALPGHDDALKFILMPMNDAAMAVVKGHDRNITAVALPSDRTLPDGWIHPSWPSLPDGRVWTYGIAIRIPAAASDENHDDEADKVCIASIGRKGSILANLPKIATKHCIFEYVPKSGLVLVRDGSSDGSLQFYGEKCFPMGLRDRQKVVHPHFNKFIGIGGTRSNRLCFELAWPEEASNQRYIAIPAAFGIVNNDFTTFCPSEGWDVHEHLTRLHLPQDALSSLNCFLEHVIGQGKLGLVCQAIDVNRAFYMAVKTFKGEAVQLHPDAMDVDSTSKRYVIPESKLARAKREVEAMGRIKHSHVVRFLGLTRNATELGICMPLYEGTLQSLVEGQTFTNTDLLRLACGVLQQMLAALIHIHHMGIMHFDVKPSNILYTISDKSECGYHFSLGDLGCCARPHQPGVMLGTPAFAGPEVHLGGMLDEKTDIWALYATIAWVLDIDQFRTNGCPRDGVSIVNAMLHTRYHPAMAEIFQMADPFPPQRPTARDINRELFPNNKIEHAVLAMQRDIEAGDKLKKRPETVQSQALSQHALEYRNNDENLNANAGEHGQSARQPQQANEGHEAGNNDNNNVNSSVDESSNGGERRDDQGIPPQLSNYQTFSVQLSQQQPETISQAVFQARQLGFGPSAPNEKHINPLSGQGQSSGIRN